MINPGKRIVSVPFYYMVINRIIVVWIGEAAL